MLPDRSVTSNIPFNKKHLCAIMYNVTCTDYVHFNIHTHYVTCNWNIYLELNIHLAGSAIYMLHVTCSTKMLDVTCNPHNIILHTCSIIYIKGSYKGTNNYLQETV